MMVRNASNILVATTYTDVSGKYSFSNLPLGTYSIYPESMGLNSTAWGSITINPLITSVNGIDFKQTSTAIKPNTSGIASVASSQSFTIFPNPSNGEFTIQWDNSIPGNAIVDVTNITGQHVYNTALNLDASGRKELNLSQLEPGIYFINITSGNNRYYQKLMIQK